MLLYIKYRISIVPIIFLFGLINFGHCESDSNDEKYDAKLRMTTIEVSRESLNDMISYAKIEGDEIYYFLKEVRGEMEAESMNRKDLLGLVFFYCLKGPAVRDCNIYSRYTDGSWKELMIFPQRDEKDCREAVSTAFTTFVIVKSQFITSSITNRYTDKRGFVPISYIGQLSLHIIKILNRHPELEKYFKSKNIRSVEIPIPVKKYNRALLAQTYGGIETWAYNKTKRKKQFFDTLGTEEKVKLRTTVAAFNPILDKIGSLHRNNDIKFSYPLADAKIVDLIFHDEPYRIEKDDTLRIIADRLYGDENLWGLLYILNSHTIVNPNLIYSGKYLRVPEINLPEGHFFRPVRFSTIKNPQEKPFIHHLPE